MQRGHGSTQDTGSRWGQAACPGGSDGLDPTCCLRAGPRHAHPRATPTRGPRPRDATPHGATPTRGAAESDEGKGPPPSHDAAGGRDPVSPWAAPGAVRGPGAAEHCEWAQAGQGVAGARCPDGGHRAVRTWEGRAKCFIHAPLAAPRGRPAGRTATAGDVSWHQQRPHARTVPGSAGGSDVRRTQAAGGEREGAARGVAGGLPARPRGLLRHPGLRRGPRGRPDLCCPRRVVPQMPGRWREAAPQPPPPPR